LEIFGRGIISILYYKRPLCLQIGGMWRQAGTSMIRAASPYHRVICLHEMPKKDQLKEIGDKDFVVF
jgi:hypothetical protein